MALRRMSVAELARETGISPGKLAARIDGGKDFKVEELKAVCNVLGTTMAKIIEQSREAA